MSLYSQRRSRGSGGGGGGGWRLAKVSCGRRTRVRIDSTEGAIGASLHSFGLFQEARALMPMLHRWSVTGSPFHSAAASIKRRAVGGLGWICPQRKKTCRRGARVSALASSENYLCGLLLAATRTPCSQSCPCPMGANAGSAGDVDSFAQLLELALFSLPFSTSPLPSDHPARSGGFSGRQRLRPSAQFANQD